MKQALIDIRLKYGDDFMAREPSDQKLSIIGIVGSVRILKAKYFFDPRVSLNDFNESWLMLMYCLYKSKIIEFSAWTSVDERQWFAAVRKFGVARSLSDHQIVKFFEVWLKPFMLIVAVYADLFEKMNLKQAECSKGYADQLG